jgi:hypothetical protein
MAGVMDALEREAAVICAVVAVIALGVELTASRNGRVDTRIFTGSHSAVV